MRWNSLVWAVALALGLAPALFAADAEKPAAPTAAEIQQWVKDLDSNSFTTRQTAARKLGEAGPAAIDELAQAAAGDSLEVTRQSIDLIRKQYEAGDAAAKTKAKAALQKIADGENKSAASRAGEILKKPEEASPNMPNALPFGPGGAGRIQIGGIRVQAQNINGAKNVEVDENGVKVKIQEDNNGIKVTKTEKVNGQDQTETFEAKDLDELKKKSPEAAKLYEKYAGKAGNVIIGGNAGGGIQIQIQGQAIPIGGNGGAPIPLPAIPIQPGQGGIQILPAFGGDQDGAKKAVESAEKSLNELKEKLKSSGLPKDQLEKVLEQLEKSQKQIAEALEKLGG